MKPSYLLLSLLLSLGPVAASYADETTVIAPGVEIHSNENRVSINAPGVHIESPNNPDASGTTIVSTTTPATSVASYANAHLEGMNFSNRDLTNAIFTNATLTGANFSGSNLTGANFSNATLTNADFTNANLTNARLNNTTFAGANLTNANLSGADLTNATFDQALISGTRFDGATMTNVDLSKAIKQAAARPAFVDAHAISTALTPDPKHPKAQQKIDLTINFDFDSDKLTSDGKRQVREIATALKASEIEKSHILGKMHSPYVRYKIYIKKA